MIVTTTNSIEGHRIATYHGIVVGEAIMGANVVRDIFAGITDIIGGRSGAYESKLQDARDYEIVGQSMLMVSASGTAVTVTPA